MNVIKESCFYLKKCIQVIGASVCMIGVLGVHETCRAEEIQFQPAQLLYAGASPLISGKTHAIPCVTDWNGDGKKDLLVGYQSDAKIALFLNTGTDESPVFTTYTNLKAAGSEICHPSPSNCGAPAPFVCDYDNDGDRDLLVGEGLNGYVFFYCNTNTDANPILTTNVQLKVGNKNLSVSLRATPYVYDWNNDGKKDLLCGTGGGTNVVFINTGTVQVPAYLSVTVIKANGVNLNLGSRSVVRMFDWDGDGKDDLVGSSSTGVYWCKNTGTPSAPNLQAMVALKAPVSTGGLSAIKTDTSRMRLDLVDWNNDGVMDMLIGNSVGTVSCLIGYRFQFSVIGRDMCGGHILDWASAPYLKYNVFAGDTVMGITNRVATNVASSGLVTCWTNVCGAPQQFFRLQIAE